MMEDHRDAYFLWKEMGIRGAACLHIDAHLDMAEFQAPLDLQVEHPEVNCANYLLKAVQEGIVSEVWWVVPPHLCQGHSDLLQWCFHELPTWVPLQLPEFNSLKLEDHRVVGQLRGARLVVCNSEVLPVADERSWLLDIDVDYFLDASDGVWEDPLQLFERLRGLQFQATTVAYSVIGGYTPLCRRYLGDLCEMLGKGQRSEAEAWMAAFHSLNDLSQEVAGLRAAALVCRAWGSGQDHQGPGFEQAAALVPEYQVDAFDVAAFYWLRKNYIKAEHWLGQVTPGKADYLRGFIDFEQKRYRAAAERWQKLLADWGESADPLSRRHLLGLLARAWSLGRRPTEAAACLHEALKLQLSDPGSRAELLRELARAQRQSGQPQAAMKSYRRALQLLPQDMANLEAQLELAELFLEADQPLRAQGELRALEQLPLPGDLQLRIERLKVKVALKGSPLRLKQGPS